MSTESLISDFPPMIYADSNTGDTVRFGHAASRAVGANIIALGRPARRIGPIEATIYDPTVGYDYNVSYSRSHADIKQLWLRWTYRPQSTAVTSNMQVVMSITDGTTTILSSSPLIPRGFKTAGIQPVTAIGLEDTRCIVGGEGYIDLDAVAALLTGNDWTIRFQAFTTADAPLELIEGWECPRSLVSDTATYGALTGPLNPGNPILAGTTTTSNYARIAATVVGGIKANHTLLSVTWPYDNAIAPALVSPIFVPFTRMLEGGATPWSWFVRPRAVYNPNSATGEPHRVRYYYRLDTSAGAPTGSIRCDTGATGSPYTTAVLASVAPVWSDWVNIDIPTNGTGRIATLQFTGKVNAITSTLRLFAIQVEENQ